MRSAWTVLAALLLLAPSAGAAEGFTIGLGVGRGWFSVDGDRLSSAAPGFSEEARLFAQGFDGRHSTTVDLHLGWNVLGHALIELTGGGTGWNPFEKGVRGGAAFGGLRTTWYPLQLVEQLRERKYDAGLELGSGYSVAGGPHYGMMGPYLQLGVQAEYLPLPWLGISAFYRHHFAFWNRFIYNADANDYRSVSGFRAGWGMIGLALNVHFVAAR